MIESGTHDSLMNTDNGKYQSMVKSQQMNLTDNVDEFTRSETNRTECTPTKRSFDSDVRSSNEDKEAKMKSTFLRLLSMNRPEWKIVFIGCLACLFNGISESLFALLLTRIIQV